MKATPYDNLWIISAAAVLTLTACHHRHHLQNTTTTLLPHSMTIAPNITPTSPAAPPLQKKQQGIPLFLEYRYFSSAKDALVDIVTTKKPRIIGFGEYHNQANHTTASALSRFSKTLLPAISSVTSDVVVEALVPTGNCAEVKKEMAQEIKEDTNRPKSTEDEVSILFKQARAHGIFPHYLTLSCADNNLIYSQETINYQTLLELIGSKLAEKTKKVMDFRAGIDRKSKPLIAVYGGAIHNDANPDAQWASVAFGTEIKKAVPKNKYIEIDLVVPELMEDISFVKQAAWYPLFKDKATKNKTLLIKRNETNFIIVFPLKT